MRSAADSPWRLPARHPRTPGSISNRPFYEGININLATDAYEKNTATTEEFNKRAETTAARLQVAKNQLNDVAITIGGALLPPLVTLARIVGKVVGVFGELLEANPRLTSVLVIAGTAVGGLALALGGILIFLPSLVAGWTLLTGAVSRYTVTVTGATGATTAFGIASRVALGPIGLLVGALGLVAGGLAWAMRDTKRELGDVDSALLSMREAGIGLSDILEKRLNRALAELKEKADEAKESLGTVTKTFEEMTTSERLKELEKLVEEHGKLTRLLELTDEHLAEITGYKSPSSADFLGLPEDGDVAGRFAEVNEEIAELQGLLGNTVAQETWAASMDIIDDHLDAIARGLEDQGIPHAKMVELLQEARDEYVKVVDAARQLGEVPPPDPTALYNIVEVLDQVRGVVVASRVELTELGKEMFGLGEAADQTTTKVTAATSAIAEELALQKVLDGITSERLRLDLLSIVAKNEQSDAQKDYGDALQAVSDLEEAGKKGTEEYTEAIRNRERAGAVLLAAMAKVESIEKALTDLLDAEAQAVNDLATARQTLTDNLAGLKQETADQADLNRRLAESETEVGDALIIRKDALEKLAAAEKAHTLALDEADRVDRESPDDIEAYGEAWAEVERTLGERTQAEGDVKSALSSIERIAEGHVQRLEGIGEDYRDEQERINKAHRESTQRENKRYHDAVEQAEDGHTKRLEDIQERATEARADAVRDLGRALEKIAIDDGNRRAELEENLEQDIAGRRREHYSSIEQAEADHQQRLLNIQTGVGEDKEEAGLRLQRSLEDIATDTANRRAELEENLAQDLADLQRGPGAIALHGTPTEERQRFLDAQFKLQQEFDRDLGDLEDGRQEDEAKARTRNKRTLADIERDAGRDREQAEADNEEKLTSLREDWQGDQIERQRKFQRDLGDLEDDRRIREAEAERRHEQTLTDIKSDAERARDEAAENQRTRLAELEERWHENLAGINTTFYESSKIAREEFNTALEDFETDLGVEINKLRTGWQKDYLAETIAFVSAIQAQYSSLANPMVPVLPSLSGDLGQGGPRRVPVSSALPSAPSLGTLDDWRLGPVPILDAGALVMGPTLAALGMNSKPEFVSPIERLPEIMSRAGQSSPLTITIYAETLMGENVTEMIQEQIQKAHRRGWS